MANVQETQTLKDTQRETVIKAIRINDSAGDDTGAVVFDASSLINSPPTGDELLHITGIQWSIGGPSTDKTVKLLWDGTPDKNIMALSGNGKMSFYQDGLPSLSNNADSPTGDILITTTNFDDGDFYTFIITCRKVSGYNFDQSSSSSSSSSE